MQSGAIGVNDVESATGAVPAVVAPLEEDEALAVRRPRGDLRVAAPGAEPDERAQVPSVRVRHHELVPVDPLRGIHRGPLRPERTGKALEGDVLPVGRPHGPPVVGLALGDPYAGWAVRGQPPKAGSVGLDDPDRVHARGGRAGEDDARSIRRPVRVGVLRALGGCVSLRTPVPSAFMTKSSPQGVFWRRRRSKTMRPFVPGGVAAAPEAPTMQAARTPISARRISSLHSRG